jgi:hypothetical protein
MAARNSSSSVTFCFGGCRKCADGIRDHTDVCRVSLQTRPVFIVSDPRCKVNGGSKEENNKTTNPVNGSTFTRRAHWGSFAQPRSSLQNGSPVQSFCHPFASKYYLQWRKGGVNG